MNFLRSKLSLSQNYKTVSQIFLVFQSSISKVKIYFLGDSLPTMKFYSLSRNLFEFDRKYPKLQECIYTLKIDTVVVQI